VILSKRERYIAIGASTAALVFFLYQYMFNPLWERRAQAQSDSGSSRMKLQKIRSENNRNRATELKWEEMNKAGLRLDANTALGQLQHAAQQWAQEARLSISHRGDRPLVVEKRFQKIVLHVSSQSATMESISRFLWRVNTSGLPVRVTDLQIRPKREASEELTLEVAISTLSAIPDKDEKPTRTVVAARSPENRGDSRAFYDRYSVLWQRSIFSRYRPQPRNDYRPPVRPEQQYMLRGIVRLEPWEKEPGSHAAFIENGISGQIQRLHVGEAIARGKITAIEDSYIEYESGGRIDFIEIGMNLERGSQIVRNEPAPTTQPTGPGTPPFVGGGPPGGLGPTTPATPVTTPPAGGITGGSTEDIAAQMKKRREAELQGRQPQPQ